MQTPLPPRKSRPAGVMSWSKRWGASELLELHAEKQGLAMRTRAPGPRSRSRHASNKGGWVGCGRQRTGCCRDLPLVQCLACQLPWQSQDCPRTLASHGAPPNTLPERTDHTMVALTSRLVAASPSPGTSPRACRRPTGGGLGCAHTQCKRVATDWTAGQCTSQGCGANLGVWG